MCVLNLLHPHPPTPAAAPTPDPGRQAGIALGRAVRGLTLRLADRELTPAAEGSAAIAVALPLLLEKGLASQVGAEV